jgi:DNA-binding IclR family transcriptional regulator
MLEDAHPGAAGAPRGEGRTGQSSPFAGAEVLAQGSRSRYAPRNHRTIDRVTCILEEVVYNPGMTFAELVKALGAAKSSVHGFIRGLVAKGWLYEEKHRFYLGPAVYGLTLASGHIRAGLVTHADLASLHNETGLAVFLGVQGGDHLIYVAEAGSDYVEGFAARSNIRRNLLVTAGGKALLASRSEAERVSFLRRHASDEMELVDTFLAEYEAISNSRIATNLSPNGSRFAIATTVRDSSGEAVASITLVGPSANMKPRVEELSALLLRRVDTWANRAMNPREPI